MLKLERLICWSASLKVQISEEWLWCVTSWVAFATKNGSLILYSKKSEQKRVDFVLMLNTWWSNYNHSLSLSRVDLRQSSWESQPPGEVGGGGDGRMAATDNDVMVGFNKLERIISDQAGIVCLYWHCTVACNQQIEKWKTFSNWTSIYPPLYTLGSWVLQCSD